MIPEGYTDDMSFPIGNGKSEDDVARCILDAFQEKLNFEVIFEKIMEEFCLTDGDADLAIDRTMGGIVCALTANERNESDSEKDPLAWRSFKEVWELQGSGDFRWHKWDTERRASS